MDIKPVIVSLFDIGEIPGLILHGYHTYYLGIF